MPVMEWSDALVLDVAAMDDTHREFVAMLNALADTPDGALLAALDRFIAHTETHFEQENRWMRSLPFPPIHCHVGEHENVLKILQEVRERALGGQPEIVRVLAQELPEWFRTHASTMDAALAHVIKATGFQPERAPATV